jgi:hypothetical protein
VASKAPGGTISGTFRNAADREGAYRLIESDAFEASEIIRAAGLAAFEKSREEEFVFVPVDGSTLTLPAASVEGGFGPVGTSKCKAIGMESMNAVVVSPRGVTLGVGGQELWARPMGKKKNKKRGGRPLEQKETVHWLNVMEQVCSARSQVSPQKARPWFQLDRGGDCRDLLVWLSMQDAYVTVRAAQDRCVSYPQPGLLWDVIAAQPKLGEFELVISGSKNRKERTARMEVRLCEVLLPLRDSWSKAESPTPVYAVYTREISALPRGEKPVEWLLLTNYAVADLESARQVIFGYSQRWKIEEVHKTWKSTCGVEESALEEVEHFAKWAAIEFVLAVRIERLKRRARVEPHLPATEELAWNELKALVLLKGKKKSHQDGVVTLGEAVRWIAELGGYTGKSSGGPPGAITIGRGLKYLASGAELIARLQENESP